MRFEQFMSSVMRGLEQLIASSNLPLGEQRSLAIATSAIFMKTAQPDRVSPTLR